DHVLRRLLEMTPSYRAAGEDSFGTRQLRRLFEEAGFRCVVWRRLNLFPNFTPRPLFRLLRRFEPAIEATPGVRALCTVNMYGFQAARDGASGPPREAPTWVRRGAELHHAGHQFPAEIPALPAGARRLPADRHRSHASGARARAARARGQCRLYRPAHGRRS